MNKSVRGGLLTLVAGAVLVIQTNAWGAAALPAGARDLTFGTHGVATLPPSTLKASGVTGVRPAARTAVASAGRVWVIGTQGELDYTMRLSTHGAPDKSFRSGHPYGAAADGYTSNAAVIPAPGGGAYLVSDEWDTFPVPYWVTRFTAKGAIDSSYGVKGRARVPFSCSKCSINTLLAVKLRSDGGLSFAGWSDTKNQYGAVPTLASLTRSGKPDTRLAPSGWAYVAGAPTLNQQDLRAAAFDSAGRAYFLSARPRDVSCDSTCAGHPYVLRATVAGALDLGYGDAGRAALPMGGAKNTVAPATVPWWLRPSLLASPSGELYVGFDERTAGSGKVTASVVHLHASGSVDASFGTGGLARFAATGGNGSLSAMGSDGKGHLVLGLTYTDSTRFLHLLLRVSASTGKVATGFGHAGAVSSPIYVAAITRLSASRLVTIGWPTHSRNNVEVGGTQLNAYAI